MRGCNQSAWTRVQRNYSDNAHYATVPYISRMQCCNINELRRCDPIDPHWTLVDRTRLVHDSLQDALARRIIHGQLESHVVGRRQEQHY